jgi:ABC-type multidrug transport system ATPase subunit
VTGLLKQDAALLVEAEPLTIVQEVSAQFGVLSQVVGSRTVKVALPTERTPELMTALVNAGAQVYQITSQHSSLEELFLELTDETHNENGQPASSVAAAAAAERK